MGSFEPQANSAGGKRSPGDSQEIFISNLGCVEIQKKVNTNQALARKFYQTRLINQFVKSCQSPDLAKSVQYLAGLTCMPVQFVIKYESSEEQGNGVQECPCQKTRDHKELYQFVNESPSGYPEIENMNTSSQKFIARNRAPRVQIEYDVEIYGSEKKIELPFVMGVLADLSGASSESLPPVAERKFLEIDVDNFDERMKAILPRVVMAVPNTLSGEGQLLVDIAFERMDDFSPAAIARNVEPLARLLEARTQLANLQTYMDGKAGAEGLMNRLLRDRALMRAIASAVDAGDAEHDAQPHAALTTRSDGRTNDGPDTPGVDR